MVLRSIIFVYLIVPFCLNAQNEEGFERYVDSLEITFLEGDLDPRERLDVLFELNDQIRYLRREDMQYMLRLGRSIALELGDSTYIGQVYVRMGELFTDAIDQDSSLFYFERALDYFQSPANLGLRARTLASLASIYFYEGNSGEDLRLLNDALNIYQSLGDSLGILRCLNNLAASYIEFGSHRIALAYLQEAIELGLDSSLAIYTSVFANMGIIYAGVGNHVRALDLFDRSIELCVLRHDSNTVGFNISYKGKSFLALGDTVDALKCFNQSIEIQKKFGNNYDLSLNYFELGKFYASLQRMDMALPYLDTAFLLYQEINSKREISETQTEIGCLYYHNDQFSEAVEWCEQAIEMARAIGTEEHQLKACNCLYMAHRKRGETEQSLKYLEEYIALEKVIALEEARFNVMEMDFRDQQVQDSIRQLRHERELELMHQEEVRKKDRARNYTTIGGIGFLVLALGLWSRLNYIRRSKKALENEKMRSEALLLNIIPKEIADELKETGKVKARRFGDVSVLFSDFEKFTETAESLSPEELVEEINICFEAFDRIVEKYKLEKIKTNGDMYMAAGGLHVPRTSETGDVVMAGIEMQAFLEGRNRHAQQSERVELSMRLGIHTGPVVAGIVGSKKFQYDIWGDTVNTASRMESHGQRNKVNISHDTYEQIKDHQEFEFIRRSPLDVKGKGEMNMWFVALNGSHIT
jgi:class 3 adenylate cyclase